MNGIQELGHRPPERIERKGEDHMATEPTSTVPKIGNRVGMEGQSGLFEVVDVNTLMQTANLRATDGQGHVIRNVPWASMKLQGAAAR
jgi:hypothetical protein